MKHIKENLGAIILSIALIICILIGLSIIGLGLTQKVTEETVSTEIVEAVVTNTDYSSYYQKNSGTKTSYIVAVRGEDFSTVFTVSSSIYAKYTVGDTAKVEKIEKWNKVQDTYYEYNLK
jgi:hypothetical protein